MYDSKKETGDWISDMMKRRELDQMAEVEITSFTDWPRAIVQLRRYLEL